MPDKPIREIDHLLTYVKNLEAAADLFRRMGFTLSPISRIETMGIANHLVLMQPVTPGCANFIELMSPQDRARLPAAMAETLSGAEGIKSMVLAAGDADAAQRAIRAQGFDAAPPVHVKREWVIAPGESVFPEFDVVLPVEAPLVFNCCQYHNVALYLRPEWLSHRNGARGMRAVMALASDPAAVAKQYGGLFAGEPDGSGGNWKTSPGGVALNLLSPAAASQKFGLDLPAAPRAAAYLGYVVEVASLDVLSTCLKDGDVPHRTQGDMICVDPDHGLGNLIVFTDRSGI